MFAFGSKISGILYYPANMKKKKNLEHFLTWKSFFLGLELFRFRNTGK